MREAPASRDFRNYVNSMITDHTPPGQDTVLQRDDTTVIAMRLWLRILHGNVDGDLGLYNIEVEEIWNALALGKTCGFHLEMMGDWFDGFWAPLAVGFNNREQDYLKSLLFPCWILDRAVAFAKVTKRLAYICIGHIEENNPTRHRDLHVPSRVIDQLNAAKGRMRGELNKALLDRTKPATFCPKKCSKRADSLESYLEAVSDTNLYPLSTQHRVSIEAIVDSPGLIRWRPRRIEGACGDCFTNLHHLHVTKIRENIREHWHGLCMDCMNISKPRNGSIHTDYWLHNQMMQWSVGCRFYHGRNTWYYSFMGRPDVMEKYQEEMTERRANGNL